VTRDVQSCSEELSKKRIQHKAIERAAEKQGPEFWVTLVVSMGKDAKAFSCLTNCNLVSPKSTCDDCWFFASKVGNKNWLSPTWFAITASMFWLFSIRNAFTNPKICSKKLLREIRLPPVLWPQINGLVSIKRTNKLTSSSDVCIVKWLGLKWASRSTLQDAPKINYVLGLSER